MRIDVGARTDVGRVRENNEDAFLVVAPINLFIVSDGMGGEAHGEVASAIAVKTIAEHCEADGADPSAPMIGEAHPDLSPRTNRLASAVNLANQRIYEASERDSDQRGMGATVVAAWLDGPKLSLVHVGDSRVYLLRAGALQQLTADHSLVAEQVRRGYITPQQAELSELQNVLTRALGPHEEIQSDAAEHMLQPGDTLILCTDGVTRMVSDEEIASTLLTTTGAQAAADRLIDLANENGGVDNSTAIIVSIPPDHDGLLDKLKLWRRD
ncbi:MAG TPA: Stp1/IreP family PP2C-type Ser/Thr phosphatase [Candidatus Acidoferrales bacterium]|nr:Stp1/IreP family PP2C-type Ser/Thr phosphatase [Candidatus Acidoferrales bacterium]